MDIKKELEKLIDLQRKESSNNFQRVIDKVDSVGTGQELLCQRFESIQEKVDAVHKTMHGNGNATGGCIAVQQKMLFRMKLLWTVVIGAASVFAIAGVWTMLKYPEIFIEVSNK